MNPLNRKMFRQPGMSRQPMGILASSPELANVVRRRTGQPVQMAHGGYHPPGDPMGRLSTSRRPVPGSVRIPLIDLLPKSGFARPALDDFLASSGAARASAPGVVIPSGGLGSLSSPPVMSTRGSGRSRPAGATNVTSVNIPQSGMGSLTSPPVMSVRGTGTSTPVGSREGVTGGPRPDVVERGQRLSEIASQDRTESTPLINNPAIASMLATTDPNILPAMPDESSGMAISGEDPTGGAGFGIPAILESIFRGGESARPKGVKEEINEAADRMPLDPGFKQILDQQAAIESAKLESEALAAATGPKVPPEGRPESDTPVVLSPPVVDKITQEGGEGTQDGDENIIPPTGQNLSDAAKDLLNRPALSAEAVNRRVDKLLGIDSAIQEKTGKPATKKERVKAEIAILKEALGEDAAKDIRTSGAYNLMMTGLMIAAGDSPDAMTNIVKGLAGGLKTYGDATGEEAQRKNKLEQSLGLQAYSNVREEIAAEKIADARLKEQKASLAGQIYVNEANNTAAMERLVAKEGFDAGRFQQTLKLQRDTLEQNLKIANMPPAEIRSLTMIQQEPQLLEIMEQAALAKDPTKMERDILGHLIKSPYFAMELAEEGGQQKLAGYATAIANAFRSSRDQDSTQAATASSGTVTSPIAISNQDDYDALPSGAIYTDPGDNKTYRKP